MRVYDGVPVLKSSWEKKMAQRQARERVREVSREYEAKKRARVEVRASPAPRGGRPRQPAWDAAHAQSEREKREEKRRRKEENELKAATYQVVRPGHAGGVSRRSACLTAGVHPSPVMTAAQGPVQGQEDEQEAAAVGQEDVGG